MDSEKAEVSPQRLAVALVLGGMALIILAGLVALVIISPEFVQATWEGIRGGPTRMAVVLFGVQLVVYAALVGGVVALVLRRRG